MPCDRNLGRYETIQQRAETIREKTEALSRALASGQVKVKVGPQGAIAFIGWADRGPVTDACAYRRIMAKGSGAAKMAIMKAAQTAGVAINQQVIGQGAHSHDEGQTWHDHK